MKKIKETLCLFFLFLLLVCCKKTQSDQKSAISYLGSESSDCVTNSSKSSDSILSNDSVWYNIDGDTLDIYLGFNCTCCSKYSASGSIKNDTLYVYIKQTQLGTCNCICYNQVKSTFYGTNFNIPYKINLDDFKIFTGEFKLK